MTKWADEFGEEYAVPAAIAEATELEDWSWRNDACPCFGFALSVPTGTIGTYRTSNDHRVSLWVEHPDQSQREMYGDEDGPRFAVFYQYDGEDAERAPITHDTQHAFSEPLYVGDDADEALRAALDAIAAVRRHVDPQNSTDDLLARIRAVRRTWDAFRPAVPFATYSAGDLRDAADAVQQAIAALEQWEVDYYVDQRND